MQQYKYILCNIFFFFFFSSRRRHTRLQGDWSSDVCSSDLPLGEPVPQADARPDRRARQPQRAQPDRRSEEHTSELQSPCNLVCRLLLEKKKKWSRTPSMLYTIVFASGRRTPFPPRPRTPSR